MARDHFDLGGRVAVVGGASRGIGAAIAEILGEYGAYVIACSRDADRCQQTVDHIRAEGGTAEAFPCHMGRMERIEALYQHVDEAHGRIDILVNNAASSP